MTRLAKKRILAAVVGTAYALVYGFWTMLVTGGGHGNFIWIMMFIIFGAFGLYFPLMAVLSADLRSFNTQVVFGSLLLFNLFGAVLLIALWILGITGERLDDFSKTWRAAPITLITCAIVHFVPNLFFAAQLINAVVAGEAREDESDTFSAHQLGLK
ncbi:MAG: hypothetical protein H0X08_01655 [Blastocatellia bacterium]|jgi:hypothetical protein|nr:hypothetical protein [Blastocatellia bacterium]